MSNQEQLNARYRDLQAYVGWEDVDAERVATLSELATPHFGALIDDFYDEIARHPEAAKVITGGPEQVERLKGTLRGWLAELLSGRYDGEYVARRWRVGARHVQIGLDQVYTNAALSRLRRGLSRIITEEWTDDAGKLADALQSLHKLLDLDLAIIEDAYQSEYARRQQQIERLATIGQMAGGLAHELRQPLNVIKTSVYYLINARSASEEKKAQHMERIERQVGLANGVITALSDFAKLPLPQMQSTPVRMCFEQALADVDLPDNVELSVEVPDGLPPARVDPDQVRIVLSNLIRNAADAMPEGGKMILSAASADGMVDLTVRDTGVGISADDLRRIMEPLFTTKARGIGLGLAISRAIVEKHDGRIAVESVPGDGATFTVTLPVAVSAR